MNAGLIADLPSLESSGAEASDTHAPKAPVSFRPQQTVPTDTGALARPRQSTLKMAAAR